MASPLRIIIINSKPIQVASIYAITDDGSSRRVYYSDGYVSTTDTVSTLTNSIPEIETFTSIGGDTLYINAVSVKKVANTSSDTGVTIYTNGSSFQVNDTLANVVDQINAGIEAGQFTITTVDTSVDYTILPQDDLVIVDTSDVTITLPETPAKPVSVKNTSAGTITLSPNGSDTIQGDTSGIISSNSSWTVYLDGTNWILI